MMPDDFYHRMCFADFQRKMYYFGRNRDAEVKNEWERVRAIVHTIAVANGAKGSAADIMPLPWDKKSKHPRIKMLTSDEINELKAAYKLN